MAKWAPHLIGLLTPVSAAVTLLIGGWWMLAPIILLLGLFPISRGSGILKLSLGLIAVVAGLTASIDSIAGPDIILKRIRPTIMIEAIT